MKRSFLLPLITLAACSPTVVSTPPPAELTYCAHEPAPAVLPDRDGTDETQLRRDWLTLEYILQLRDAWADCAAKVAGIKAWSEEIQ